MRPSFSLKRITAVVIVLALEFGNGNANRKLPMRLDSSSPFVIIRRVLQSGTLLNIAYSLTLRSEANGLQSG
jgi:hypothetical protein